MKRSGNQKSMHETKKSKATVRTASEQKFKGNEIEALKKSVETMQLGVTITDIEGNILYSNPAEAQMHGYSTEELIGKSAKIFAPEVEWQPMSLDQLRTLKSWKRESLNKRKDGSSFPVSLLSDVVKNTEGDPIGIVTTCEDITERKMLEKMLVSAKRRLEKRVVDRTRKLNEANEQLKRELQERLKAEIAFLESQRHFREVLENANLIAFLLDDRGNIFFCNDYSCSLTGYNREEIIGKNWFELFAPSEQHKKDDDFFSKNSVRMNSSYAEGIILTRGGEKRFITWENTILRNSEQEFSGIACIGMDVTEQRASEEKVKDLFEKVRLSKTEWESTADSLIELVCMVDNQGKIHRTNKTLEAWDLGSVKEIKGCDIHKTLHPDCDDACYFNAFWVDSLQKICKGEYQEFSTFDKILNRHVYIRINPITEVPSGKNAEAMVILIRDVSGQVRAEENIKKKQQALESVYEMAISTPGSIGEMCKSIGQNMLKLLGMNHFVICMVEGTQFNTACADAKNELCGQDCISIDNSPCNSIIKKKEICQLNGNLSQLFPQCSYILRHNIETFVGVPLKNSLGDILGIAAAMDEKPRALTENELLLIEIYASYLSHEIERKTMELKIQQSQRMQLIGQLTAGVAHEVRNPLSAILALTEAIAMDLEQHPDYGPMLSQIKLQVERLSHLMEDLLDFGRATQKSQFAWISLYHSAIEAINLREKSKQNLKHKIRIVLPLKAEEFKMYADNLRMQQVFFNLIENAEFHSPENSEIIIEFNKPAGNILEIRVIDHGSGISPGNLQRVFDPFFTMRRAGTGLGLTLVKQIIEAHGGEIILQNNNPPPGCTAYIKLPIIHEKDISPNKNME